MPGSEWNCSKCSFHHLFPRERCAMCNNLRVTKAQMNDFINGKEINVNSGSTHKDRDNGSQGGNGSSSCEGVAFTVAQQAVDRTIPTIAKNDGTTVSGQSNDRTVAIDRSSSSVPPKTSSAGRITSPIDARKGNHTTIRPTPSRQPNKIINPYFTKRRSEEVANIQIGSSSKSTNPSVSNHNSFQTPSQKPATIANPYNTKPKQFHGTSDNVKNVGQQRSNSNTRVNNAISHQKDNQTQVSNSGQGIQSECTYSRNVTKTVHNPYAKQNTNKPDNRHNQPNYQNTIQSMKKTHQQPQHQSHYQNRMQSNDQYSINNPQQPQHQNLPIQNNTILNCRLPPSSRQVQNPYLKSQQNRNINRQTPNPVRNQPVQQRQTTSTITATTAPSAATTTTTDSSAQPPSHQNHDRHNNNMSSCQKVVTTMAAVSSGLNSSNHSFKPNSSNKSRQQKLTISSSNKTMIAERNVRFRNFEQGPVPLAGAEIIKNWIYPKSEKYAEREYQLVISQSAIMQNTLVSLPTGLGKTLIASVVMYNFYRWYPTGKVVFLAPTRPLVTQQIEACYNIMGVPEIDTAEMSGKTKPSDRITLWNNRRLFFCTPQTFQKDLEEERCDAKKVVCVVFDEAHKATGKYAYVQVIELIERYGAKFRVVGLSATPGKNIKNISEVVKALKISKIEARLDTDDEVKKYVHSREIEKIVVEPTEGINVVTSLFGKLINPLLDKLREKGGIVNFRGGNSTMTSYNLFLSMQALQGRVGSSNQHYYHLFSPLIALLKAKEGLRQNGMRFARLKLLDFMEKKQGYFPKIAQSDAFTNLWHAVVDTQDLSGACPTPSQLKMNNPKLSKLEEILNEHFLRAKATNSSSRAIVFSQWRDSVEEIVNVLNASRPLVCPKKFVGQGTSSSADKSNNEKGSVSKVTGMNQKEQQRVIKEFRTGLHNVLVCTCIGEEGLDIGEVDLIVNFDCLRSPIRMVQRTGRTGRKRNGRVVCLMSKGQEERKLKEAEASTKLLWQVLKKPNYPDFVFQKNEPMLPAHPILDRRVMHISTTYRLSQIGGHKQSKQHRKKFENLDDDNWTLSVSDDLKRIKIFGGFEGNEKYFTLKKSLKIWESSISLSMNHRINFGLGSSSQVLRSLSSDMNNIKNDPSLKTRKLKNSNRTSSLGVIESDQLYDDGNSRVSFYNFESGEDNDIDIVSDDEGDHDCFYPSDQEKDMEKNMCITHYDCEQGQSARDHLDCIFGEREWPKYSIPQIFENIIFESDDDDEIGDDKMLHGSEGTYGKNNEDKAANQCHGHINLLERTESKKEGTDDFSDGVLMEDKLKNEIDQAIICTVQRTNELKFPQELGSKYNEPNFDTDKADNAGEKSKEDTMHKEELRNEVHGLVPVQPLNANDTCVVDNISSCYRLDVQQENYTGEALPSFCFDLPSQESSTSSSEDTDSSTSSNLSFTIQVNNEIRKDDKIESNKLSLGLAENDEIEDQCAECGDQSQFTSIQAVNAEAKVDGPPKFSTSPSQPLNTFQQNPVNTGMAGPTSSSVMNSQRSSSVPPESPFILNRNYKKRSALAIDNTPSQKSLRSVTLGCIDLIDTPDQSKICTMHRADSAENLTDTPLSLHNKQTGGKVQSDVSESLIDTQHFSEKKILRKTKMRKLLNKKVKGKRKDASRCQFLDLEAAGSSDGEESDEDSDEGLSQDSFINDSSQLGYSQGQNLSQHHEVSSYWQIDAQQGREESFCTPIFNRRQQALSQVNIPSSERGIGKMHFIRSVIDHHRQGGDINDIEKEYKAMLENPNQTQNGTPNT